jgi:3-oxoacyl-(acyl-carrier-protein) synthase
LGYLAGIKGPALLCPFDRRRNGTLLGEGAAVFCVENLGSARKRRAPVLAKVKAVSGYFDGNKIGRVNPSGEGLEKTVRQVLDASGMSTQDIGYISASANSSPELDRAEARVLKNIFGGSLKKMPVSAIKSMLGETISAAGSLQIASVIGAFSRGKIPPTINYLQEDPECQLDCVPNQARHREVKTALVLACGPGGYNSACVLEKP